MAMDLKEITKNLPPEAMPVLQKAGYFEADRLEVGSEMPSLNLKARADGSFVTVGGPGGDRPTVLIFGSYT
jgi:hypothetical protein